MDYQEFSKNVYRLCGIELDCYKEKQMHRRIDSLIAKRGIGNYADYFRLIKSDKSMLSEFLGHITINVSEFYRNPQQWDILKKEIYPDILNKNKTPKIWSAACSTGDEPYTLVMTLAEFLPLANIKIIATDIDDEILNKAKSGMYTKKSLDSLPKQYVEKYFDYKDEIYIVKETVKRCVEFKKHNLLKDRYPDNVDLIVCRNVLIYFTNEAKDNIYSNFRDSLKNGGVLFIGSTEQIIGAEKYGLKSLRTFFYKKILSDSNHCQNSRF